MEPSASKTAALVTAYRARATERGDKVCDDPWAAAFTTEEGRALARRFDEAFPACELWIALRTAFLDDLTVRLMGTGVSQVVVLGAGFDTRAARLRRPDLGEDRRVEFYEVDHPATQTEKLRRLSKLEGYPVEAARYVGCDFERQDFLEKLVAAGFSIEQPALILWEGVTYYLTEEVVRATLRRIAGACSRDSVVAFDLVRKKLVTGKVRDPADMAPVEVVADLGEPLRFGTDDVLPLLHQEGYRYVRAVSFDEICLAKTGTYERARAFRFQHLAVASPGTPVLA